MANTTLIQTGAQVQADLNKVEELATIKSIGTGLSLSNAGVLSANGSTYTAGTGITIASDIISATGVQYTSYSSGTPSVQANALKFVKLTQTDYDNLQTVDADTFYIIIGA